jgi:hypothetical protein
LREFYVRAEYTEWNYAPSGLEHGTQGAMEFSESVNVFVRRENTEDTCRIGPAFKKARYFAYTDASFTTRMPSHPSLGINGPVLRAIVGDRIEVHFQNALVSKMCDFRSFERRVLKSTLFVFRFFYNKKKKKRISW